MNVLITGVSSGIGLGLAEHYLREGHRVWGISRRRPKSLDAETLDAETLDAETLDAETLDAKTQWSFLSLDLGRHDLVRQSVPDWLKGVERLDLVILNAGVLGKIADMRDTRLDDLEAIMNINVWANKTLLDCLTDCGCQLDQVVAISSGAAVNGNRGWNGYAISKAALNMLVQLYAKELPDTHFTALAPGLVDTAMQDYLCGLDDPRFPSLENLKSRRHTEEMPTPDQLAPRLAEVIAGLSESTSSGEFVDIRELAEEPARR